MRPPRIDAEAAFTSHAVQVRAVEDLEDQAEALFEFTLPLFEYRRRRRDDDRLGLLAEQQFACDEPGFDRLAETGVIGDEQIHARQSRHLPERLHLIGVDLDAGAERRLEKVGVRRRNAVPAQRVQKGRKLLWVIETLGSQVLPALLLQNPSVDLEVPKHLKRLALSIVVGARESDDRRLAWSLLWNDLLDQPSPGTDLDEVSKCWRRAVPSAGTSSFQRAGNSGVAPKARHCCSVRPLARAPDSGSDRKVEGEDEETANDSHGGAPNSLDQREVNGKRLMVASSRYSQPPRSDEGQAGTRTGIALRMIRKCSGPRAQFLSSAPRS